MGIGQLGVLGNSNILIKRKFRWTLELLDPSTCATIVQPQFVKVAARPNLSVEETEIDFLNNKMWVPGKTNWEEMTITYYGISTNDQNTKDLWEFLAWQYNNPQSPFPKDLLSQATNPCDSILKLYDGCGNVMEEWKMSNCSITAINFGELDYTSSEEVTIELTMRYSKVEYKSHCPGVPGYEPQWEGIMATKEEWKMPDEWIIKCPVMESSSPGERILDQFLRRTASR
jgi:hypothetical protein